MKQKVLLMGMRGSGKTSMRSIIFANFLAKDTRRLGPTLDVEQSTMSFLGDMALNIWDCGAHDNFMESYFTTQREKIFSNTAVLIYVFDLERPELTKKDITHFHSCLNILKEYSPHARIFCLLHKMDLLPPDMRSEELVKRQEYIKKLAENAPITFFGTSIWDETLYKAWSSIVHSLVPNIDALENNLRNFSQICEADAVILFERSTFLVVSHSSRISNFDTQMFEQVSTIIKQFKLSCMRSSQSQFQSMHMNFGRFSAFIEGFTTNTFVMVITSDPAIEGAVTMMNIGVAKPHFERLIQTSAPIANTV